LYSYGLNQTVMIMNKPKLIFQTVLGIFFLSLAMTACNNSSENKTTTDTTSTKMDTATKPMMDTSSKMDTAKTKPVSPGN